MKNPPYLLRGDKLLLLGFGLALFVMALFTNPPVSDLGARQLQSVREMSHSGDWLIPTVGGSPQLQHTPIAPWSVLLVAATGLPDVLAARLVASTTLAMVACMVASVAARVFGRRAGLLAGLMTFSSMSLLDLIGGAIADLVPSASIMLVVVVSLHGERIDSELSGHLGRFPSSLLTSRPRALCGLFAALALAAFCNGLMTVCAVLLLPLGCYVVTSRHAALMRHFLWLWGAVAIVTAASVWPWLVWRRLPDVVAIWSPGSLNDWLAFLDPMRLQTRAELGCRLALKLAATWGLGVPLGLWWIRHEALGTRRSPQRLLWYFATLGPATAVLFIEQPRTALLSSVLLWNVLAAVGLEHSVAAIAASVRDILLPYRLRLPMPQLRVSPASISSAFACFLLLFVPLLWRDVFGTRAASSMQLLTETLRRESASGDLVVVDMELGDDAPLALYALPGRAVAAHNLAYLLDDQLPNGAFVVVTRRDARGPLTCLGEVTEVLEITDGEALSAFRVKLNPELVRFKRTDIRMSLAQAMHSEPGPWPFGMELSSQSEHRLKSPTMIASGHEAIRQ